MCRMILGLGISRAIFNPARSEWISNPHGWGLFANVSGKWIEWHTLNSDVPIPTNFLPRFVDGLFHIRYATINRQMGGIHPFEENGIIYAHNGTIYPHSKVSIDSQMIGRYYKKADGDLKSKMISVVNNLNKNHSGTWNIIAMNKKGDKAFGYCDGSLVKVYDMDGNIIALMSDERPLKYFPNYTHKSMAAGEWTYLEKNENGVWEEKEIGIVELPKQYYNAWTSRTRRNAYAKYAFANVYAGWY